MIPVLKLNAIQALALSGAGVALGIWLKRKLPLLDRLNIPASIAGGLVFALIALLAHDRWFNLEVNTALRDVLMIASFSTIGMSAGWGMIRKGGVQVALMTGLAFLGAIGQGMAGIAVARVFGLDPRIGVLAGPVALAGGPSTSLAFGPLFERMGATGATTVALASATFGIVVAGLVSGWSGGVLIRRSRLVPAAATPRAQSAGSEPHNRTGLLTHALLLTVAMGFGSLISTAFDTLGIILPGFVGAMLAAMIIRNVDAETRWFEIDQGKVDEILGVLLPLFISMTMLFLELWELTAIALPLLIIVIVEVVLTWLFSFVVAFAVMGADYEAAVMSAGFYGFMVGITPNAMASMEELSGTYGPAPRAFLVIPLVGAFLSDLTNSLVLTTFANILRVR